MKIGIFGGTFNPIHIGHLIGAEQARSEGSLDQVWFMPSHVPPHKENDTIMSWEHRVAMVNMAIEGNPFFKLLPIEKDRVGPSYTFDTITILKQTYPDHDFSFVLGTDMVSDLANWHEADKLSRMISFVGMKRPGYELAENEQALIKAFDIRWVSQLEIGISSTDIRQRIRTNKTIRYLVPEKVFDYIEENKLYGS